MNVKVVRFDPQKHLTQTASVLLRMRRVDPTYPPPIDAESNLDSLTQWLLSDPPTHRWVALKDGVAVGHIAVALPHEYLNTFFADRSITSTAQTGFREISKFFVDPYQQKNGIGTLLFDTALHFVNSESGQSVLAVVDSSTAAKKFYARAGLREVGTFEGIHGVNHVFIDPAFTANVQHSEHDAPSGQRQPLIKHRSAGAQTSSRESTK